MTLIKPRNSRFESAWLQLIVIMVLLDMGLTNGFFMLGSVILFAIGAYRAFKLRDVFFDAFERIARSSKSAVKFLGSIIRQLDWRDLQRIHVDFVGVNDDSQQQYLLRLANCRLSYAKIRSLTYIFVCTCQQPNAPTLL